MKEQLKCMLFTAIGVGITMMVFAVALILKDTNTSIITWCTVAVLGAMSFMIALTNAIKWKATIINPEIEYPLPEDDMLPQSCMLTVCFGPQNFMERPATRVIIDGGNEIELREFGDIVRTSVPGGKHSIRVVSPVRAMEKEILFDCNVTLYVLFSKINGLIDVRFKKR